MSDAPNKQNSEQWLESAVGKFLSSNAADYYQHLKPNNGKYWSDQSRWRTAVLKALLDMGRNYATLNSDIKEELARRGLNESFDINGIAKRTDTTRQTISGAVNMNHKVSNKLLGKFTEAFHIPKDWADNGYQNTALEKCNIEPQDGEGNLINLLLKVTAEGSKVTGVQLLNTIQPALHDNARSA